MSLLSKLLNVIIPKPITAMDNLTYFKPTHRALATWPVPNGSGHFRVNEKSLERNKYAPWGRGVNSGLPIENKACQDTRVNKKAINSFN